MPWQNLNPAAPRRAARPPPNGTAVSCAAASSARSASCCWSSRRFWFSDTLRIPTDGPSFANGAEPDKTSSAGVKHVESPAEPTHRALNPLQPLKLWVGGDSLAGALGPSLGKMTAATGVVQPYYDSRISTGLISGNIDWPRHATEQLAQMNPEVVVFMIGTNDAVVYNDSQAEEYAQKVDEMMRVLIGMGRGALGQRRYSLNQSDEKNVLEVNRIQREVSARFPTTSPTSALTRCSRTSAADTSRRSSTTTASGS